MSFDQLPNEVATGGWYLDELKRAWRATSGEADDAYANWSGSLTRSDYDAYIAATDRADGAAAALAAEQVRRRASRDLRWFPSRADVVM